MPSPNNGIHLLVGCDPEVFLTRKADKALVSAHSLLPGTKDMPYGIQNGAVQVDGVAAEFNITPAPSGDHFYAYVSSVMQQMKDMLPDHTLRIEPAVVFDEDYFMTIPEESRVLGCNPDWNAWTETINPAPDGNGTTMRTASGHLHIGWTKNQDINDPVHQQDCFRVVRQMDYYLGMYSLLWDTDSRRRNLYGKAGSCRIKPYGTEYRALSNMWLRHPNLWPWIWGACYQAVNGLVSGSSVYMPDEFGDLARKTIDDNNFQFVTTNEFKKQIHPKMGLQWPTW